MHKAALAQKCERDNQPQWLIFGQRVYSITINQWWSQYKMAPAMETRYTITTIIIINHRVDIDITASSWINKTRARIIIKEKEGRSFGDNKRPRLLFSLSRPRDANGTTARACYWTPTGCLSFLADMADNWQWRINIYIYLSTLPSSDACLVWYVWFMLGA